MRLRESYCSIIRDFVQRMIHSTEFMSRHVWLLQETNKPPPLLSVYMMELLVEQFDHEAYYAARHCIRAGIDAATQGTMLSSKVTARVRNSTIFAMLTELYILYVLEDIITTLQLEKSWRIS